MAHKSYEDAISGVYKGMWLLGFVTLLEVIISLAGKGHLGAGIMEYKWLLFILALGIIALSLYKAYFIVYEFMHMGSELRGLRLTVLMPMLLLVWAVIAFFQEGDSWNNRREQIREKDKEVTEESIQPEGLYIIEPDELELYRG